MMLPLGLLLLALPPRQPALIAAGVIAVLAAVTGSSGEALWYLERGWALVLAAWFLVAVVALPKSGFVSRGVAAVVATMLTAAVPMMLRQGAFGTVDGLVSARLRESAGIAVAALTQGAGFERVSTELTAMMYDSADLRALLFPALLGLGSLAALAVAWWGYRRIAARDPQPLAPLRDFRFPDAWIWMLIAGIVLLLLPWGAAIERTGTNIFAFMAVLYALRGVAVLLVIGGVPGPIGMLLGALVVIFLSPVVAGATFVVGLTDTWLDLRSRRTALPPGS